VPEEVLLWQDPVPEVDHALIDDSDIAELKQRILASGLTTGELVRTAWASASTFRDSDMRGGANGARIRLAPQKDWAVNDPASWREALRPWREDPDAFNAALFRRQAGLLADLIVLGGAAAIERRPRPRATRWRSPSRPGRTDATQEQTDVESFAVLEPTADGFRNYFADVTPVADRDAGGPADLLGLTRRR
jgi:catalase-peroxidase